MPLKSENSLIITSLYAYNFSKLELFFQSTDNQTPSKKLKLYYDQLN